MKLLRIMQSANWSAIDRATQWFLFTLGIAALATWFGSRPAWWLLLPSIAILGAIWYLVYRIVLAFPACPAEELATEGPGEALRAFTATEANVVSAIENLGYNRRSARQAVATAYRGGATTFDALLRASLVRLSSRCASPTSAN